MTQALNFFIHPSPVPTMGTPNDLLTDLVAYWALDEASGATRNDSHGTNHLTNNGTVGQATGVVMQAASFDGTVSNYLSIPDNATLSMGDIDFTITCWVRFTTNTGTRVLVCKGSSAGAQGQEFQVFHSATFKFELGNGAGTGKSLDSGVAAANNTWYFLRVWHDSLNNEVGIAVNESTIVTESYTSGSYNSGHEMTIGRYSNFAGGQVSGRIDEVAIWKHRILTEDDADILYHGGAGFPYAMFQ